MLIKPRQELLDIWRAVADFSMRKGEWEWGGRQGRNSISDAEQLLCILYPATQVTVLRLDDVDEIGQDVLTALRALGEDIDAVRRLLDVLLDYMSTYRDDGGPTFPVGEYLEPDRPEAPDAGPNEAQQRLEVVDSYSMSVTLCLAVIGFAITLRTGVTNPRTVEKIDILRTLASERLTAAMTGLIRSFTINVFEVDSDAGRNLVRSVNQSDQPPRLVAERLSRELRDIRTRLREEVSIGSVAAREELQNEQRLFECGWSWGVVKDAGLIGFVEGKTPQLPGLAEDRPYLYFTGVALDGIEDLFDARTRILGLLNDDQQRLASSLQLRWELSLEFWTRIATFGTGRWPLEDVPWRTTDGVENDYFSLFVASMLVQRVSRDRPSEEWHLRIGRILEDLANRGRITRRPLPEESALNLHSPGVRLRLMGTEALGGQQVWNVSSYSSLLLKRTVATANLIEDTEERDRISALADRLWQHLLDRRMGLSETLIVPGIEVEGSGLWDQPTGAFPMLDRAPSVEPSWYHSQRIVECLVLAAKVINEPPRVSEQLRRDVGELLSEAERVFDQEQLNGSPTGGRGLRVTIEAVGERLDRARELRDVLPGMAKVIVEGVLRDLEEIITARRASGATVYR